MFPLFGSNKAINIHKEDRICQRQELKEKYSFLLKPSQRHHIISAFIPKNLVYFTSPRKKEKSPLRVIEIYNKEKPLETSDERNSKYFRSISPKLLNFLSPAKLHSKQLPPIQIVKKKASSIISSKIIPDKLPNLRHKSSKTPDPTIKFSPKSSDDFSNYFDKISSYMNMLK